VTVEVSDIVPRRLIGRWLIHVQPLLKQKPVIFNLKNE